MQPDTFKFKTSHAFQEEEENKKKSLKERRTRDIQIAYGNLLQAIENHAQTTLDTQKAIKMIRKSYRLLKVKP